MRFSLSLGISGITLFLAVRHISISEILSSFIRVAWLYVGLALLSVFINTAGKIFRWQVLIRPNGPKVGLKKLSLALLAGQALNTIYPARIGDLSRAYVTGANGEEKAYVLGTITLEKFIDLLCYAGLLWILILAIPMPVWLERSMRVTVILALILLVSVLLISRFRRVLTRIFLPLLDWQPPWISVPLWDQIKRILRSGFSSLRILKEQGELAKISLWSLVVWITATLTNYLVLLALDIKINGTGDMLLASLLVLVGLMVGIGVPSVPGRIGIFEYICVLALAVFHIPQAQAFTYGVILHSIVFILPTLAGLISVFILGLGIRQARLTALTGSANQNIESLD